MLNIASLWWLLLIQDGLLPKLYLSTNRTRRPRNAARIGTRWHIGVHIQIECQLIWGDSNYEGSFPILLMHSSLQRFSKNSRIVWPACPTADSSSLNVSQLLQTSRKSLANSSRLWYLCKISHQNKISDDDDFDKGRLICERVSH